MFGHACTWLPIMMAWIGNDYVAGLERKTLTNTVEMKELLEGIAKENRTRSTRHGQGHLSKE